MRSHPLTLEEIKSIVLSSWKDVWNTMVGGKFQIPLSEINPPASMIGYFLEKVIARKLSIQYPKTWKEGTGTEKDFHCLKDAKYSIEMKSSGQLGSKIYGNRSYGKKAKSEGLVKKTKSGYYLTVNFFKDQVTLIRFGWIDNNDWKPQKSQSGQMSGLKKVIYESKLLPIKGDYILKGPVSLINDIGPKTALELHKKFNISSIQELLDFKGEKTKQLEKCLKLAYNYIEKYHSCN